MTKEEYERGLELQGYRKSIEDMTLGDIALKFLKKHHLPKFLKTILVKFAHPLLLFKDVDLEEARKLLNEAQGYIENNDDELYDKIEQFLKEIEK